MKQVTILFLLFATLLAFGDAGLVMPPEWEPMADSQYNMSLYAQVEDFDGNRMEASGSVLAVFNADGQCCGAAAIEEGSCGMWYQVKVVANAIAETGLTLKLLSGTEGEVFDIQETIDFAADSTIPATNYATQPLMLHCKPLTAKLTLTLVQNWNWISFNVEQGERTILEFLEDYTQYATDGDIIKSQNGQATFSGGQWYPSPKSFRLEPGRMYKLRKQRAGNCTVTVSGVPCVGEVPIVVVAGWNWLGYTGVAEATVSALFKAEGFADNDLVMAQSGSQATFSDGKWQGNLVFRPGLGYMLKLSAAGTVDFRNAE